MNKTKLLIVAPDYYPAHGGVERFVQDLAEYLIQSPELEIKILSGTRLQKLPSPVTEAVNGIEITRIPTINPMGLDFPRHFKYYKKIAQMFHWADIIRLNDVRLFFLSASLIGILRKKKLILTPHGFIFHKQRYFFFKKLYTSFFCWVLRNFFTHVLPLGYVDLNFCKKHRINASLIEAGINLSLYQKVNRSPRSGYFLYFGRIDHNKNLDCLLKNLSLYAEKHKKFHLYICGKGDQLLINELKKITTHLSLADEVSFLGEISQEELLHQLSLAEIIFIPSTFESFGYTLVESMAAGCTVVANDILQFNQMLKKQQVTQPAVYLVNYALPHQFCTILTEACQDFQPVNISAQNFAKQYDEKNCLEGYRTLFVKMLNFTGTTKIL